MSGETLQKGFDPTTGQWLSVKVNSQGEQVFATAGLTFSLAAAKYTSVPPALQTVAAQKTLTVTFKDAAAAASYASALELKVLPTVENTNPTLPLRWRMFGSADTPGAVEAYDWPLETLDRGMPPNFQCSSMRFKNTDTTISVDIYLMCFSDVDISGTTYVIA